MSNAQQPIRETGVIVENVRLAFPAIFEPRPKIKGATELTYQVTLLIPKDRDLAAVKAAMQHAYKAKWGNKQVKLTRGSPLKDGDEKEYNGFADHFYLATSSKDPVPVVDARGIPVTDPSKVFAGCYANVYVNFWAWDNSFGRGVNAELMAVQFLRPGERLDGRPSKDKAAAAFGVVEVAEESDESPEGGANGAPEDESFELWD